MSKKITRTVQIDAEGYPVAPESTPVVRLRTGITHEGNTVGEVRWNDTDKCVEYVTINGVVIQIAQETVKRCRNTTGINIPNGKAVYVSGATGNRPLITLASKNSMSQSEQMIGLVTDESGIDHNSDGFVTVVGVCRGIDTSGLTEGLPVYLSTSGNWTNTKPTTEGEFVVRIGYCTRSNPSEGEILVAPNFFGSTIGYSLLSASSKSAARSAISLGHILPSAPVDWSDVEDNTAYDLGAWPLAQVPSSPYFNASKNSVLLYNSGKEDVVLHDISLTNFVSIPRGGWKIINTFPDNPGTWSIFVVEESNDYVTRTTVEDIEITDFAKGIILKSPDQSRWRITVDNSGALTTTEI